jgi:hypothetical protein
MALGMVTTIKDTYARDRVQGQRDWPHSELEARFVAVLKSTREDRGLELIRPATRAIRKNEIHEFILTDENDAAPGKVVDRVAYMAFAEFTKGGMLVEGDKVVINGQTVGEIAGFDETHMPNHQNIVIRGPDRKTGLDLGAKVGDLISFIPVFTKG